MAREMAYPQSLACRFAYSLTEILLFPAEIGFTVKFHLQAEAEAVRLGALHHATPAERFPHSTPFANGSAFSYRLEIVRRGLFVGGLT